MRKKSDAFKKFLRLETRIESPEGPHVPAIRGTLEEKIIEVQRRRAEGKLRFDKRSIEEVPPGLRN